MTIKSDVYLGFKFVEFEFYTMDSATAEAFAIDVIRKTYKVKKLKSKYYYDNQKCAWIINILYY